MHHHNQLSKHGCMRQELLLLHCQHIAVNIPYNLHAPISLTPQNTQTQITAQDRYKAVVVQ